MKKLFAVILSVVLLVQICCLTASAEEQTTYTPYLQSVQEMGSYEGNLEDLRYFPFRYTSASNFAWFRENVIGPNDCQEGVLYVKDLFEETIQPLTDTPVLEYKESGNTLYYLLDEFSLYRVDIFQQEPIPVHSSSVPMHKLTMGEQDLFFIEGNQVQEVDTSAHTVSTYATCEGITGFAFDDDENLVWGNSRGGLFRYNTVTRASESMEVPVTMKLEAEPHLHDVEADAASQVEMQSYARAIAPVSLPLPEYPVGSYFTKDGEYCGHHDTGTCDYYGGCNCKPYDASIQCVGFAKSASDRYAHRTSWTRPDGDTEWDVYIGTESLAKQFMVRMSRGSYVTFYSPSHSFVVLSTSGSSMTTYDCNVNNDCRVTVENRTYASIASKYGTVEYGLTHHFNGKVSKLNSQYHTVACSSDCTGYTLQAHYASSPGSNATCTACGYVGKIDSGLLQSVEIPYPVSNE